jgi:hypothetical protein
MSLIWINPKHILQHAVEKSGVLAGDVKENKSIPYVPFITLLRRMHFQHALVAPYR